MDPAHALALSSPSWWGTAFAAGFLSFFTPCTLPLLPAYLSYLTGADYEELIQSKTRWRVSGHALLFILGFSSVFVLLGASASALGNLIAEYQRAFEFAGGILMIGFGLFMCGALRIPALYKDVRFRHGARPAGYAGSVLIGASFAAGWSPCIGPILSVILLMASQSQHVWEGMLFLGVYSLGLAVPFFIASLLLERFMTAMRGKGHWLGRVEFAAGLLLIVVGVSFLAGWWGRLAGWTLRWGFTPRY